MNIKFSTKKYPLEGDLQHSYSPLKNMLNKDNSIVNFNTNELSINLNNPLNIECQPSYDGTVNLIINDDVNPPRIINSRFTTIENNRFKIINRNQSEQTNLYKEGSIDLQTRLFRNINCIPKIAYVETSDYGQLKGGNYTFYVKFADDDGNKTDIVCESSQVSVFKGSLFNIKSISGTLQDERTNKCVKISINNIDTSFSKLYLHYTREYSSTSGNRMVELVEIIKPYDITDTTKDIIINGFEDYNVLDLPELNIQYNYTTNVKTQAQVQNMLFFGNIENSKVDIKNLQNISYFIDVKLKQKSESIGWVEPDAYEASNDELISMEYYDPKNIYYNLGYWPDEMYRLGIVYIMKDDSLSPVFNLRGCVFNSLNESNLDELPYYDETSKKTNYLERDTFIISTKQLANTFGVFKNPVQDKNNVIQNYSNFTTKPWYYEMSFESAGINLFDELRKYGVKGFFFVRQKRLPTILCQGVSVGIDKSSYIPALYDKNTGSYFTESFLNQSSGHLDTEFETSKITSKLKWGSGLLSLEACVSPSLQSIFDGNSFMLQKIASCGDNSIIQKSRRFIMKFDKNVYHTYRSLPCVFVSGSTPFKYVNGYGFSTKAGSAEDVKEFRFFGDSDDKYSAKNYKLVRGIYAPIIGVCGNLDDNALYNVRISTYSTQYLRDYFEIRKNDISPFYAISDRYGLDENKTIVDVYRGDCYTSTATIRLNRNFSDPEVPINDTIIDAKTWIKNYGGYFETTSNDKDEDSEHNWAKINRADLNAVPMGMWVTYKCLSNYNLGLRSEDRSYVDEMALTGNARSFYPLQDINVFSSNNIDESFILNDGYSSTVGRRNNIIVQNVPYTKELFDNRIMFSKIQTADEFQNSYRIFQGLSYKDIDRQYGAIVKILPWGTNLLCVFEHGIGIVPVNEKVLMQTSTEQPIHLYGSGVLQSNVSLISSDFGSIWPESIIKTPIGVYGVDTYAKKIWKYSDAKGLETISDMKVQKFLNDNVILKESDKYPTIGLKNVKTHYNNYKGDVMFTFYNFLEGVEWNLCYNERQAKWITKYSWTPLYSENVNNIYYSLDKKRSEILAHIYDNRHTSYGIRTSNNEWGLEGNNLTLDFSTDVELTGVSLATDFDIIIDNVKTSYINDSGIEVDIEMDPMWVNLIKVKNTDNPLIKRISWDITLMVNAFKDYGLSYKVPLYYKLGIVVKPKIKDSYSTNWLQRTIGIVVDYNYAPKEYDELLVNGFYVHGRAGIFNEIDYNDSNPLNNIRPTNWYNKQEPFEFEFIVNEPTGLHKIFENLVIYSNNVAPESIQFEIVGDSYSLFKVKDGFDRNLKKEQYENNVLFKNASMVWDNTLNEYSVLMTQKCKSIEKFGRRLGNMHYKEDAWYITINPLLLNKNGKTTSTKLRDKYLKVRVRYSGEDLAVITAIKSMVNLSAS